MPRATFDNLEDKLLVGGHRPAGSRKPTCE